MSEALAKCVVCHRDVQEIMFRCFYYDVVYHFCSKKCLEVFKLSPSNYPESNIETLVKISRQYIISLKKPLDRQSVDLIRMVLLKVPGVLKVVINIQNIYVTYVTNNSQEDESVKAFSEIDRAIRNGWFECLKDKLASNKTLKPDVTEP